MAVSVSDILEAEPKALIYARQIAALGVTTLAYLHCQIHCHFKDVCGVLFIF